ncbi:MAG: deoxyribonuclease IV [Victivallaceae bacterium]|nr:deoxyribonuclease IV [Victivallaceae bacterium]
MKYFGAHVSTQGGLANAPRNARAVGADAFALFTKNQRQWFAPALSGEAVADFAGACKECGFSPEQILAHDSYLINLGQPDDGKRDNAIAAFTHELERCRRLGLTMLNFHPGSSLLAIDDRVCIERIALAVQQALDEVPGVTAVFENTAGQGSNLGHSFEQLAEMLEKTDRPGRTGVCIDTCHAYAAGYDLATDEGYEKTMAGFDRLIGFSLLKGMHLNDARCELGGRLDRHEGLGDGKLGWETFRRIAQDERIDNIPLILETPHPERWAGEIARLKEFASGKN